jgi:hypothetical protein
VTGIVIHRSRHTHQYVVVPNAIARNDRLSFRARGLLVMLLSLPPDWHVTADMLAEDNPDSRTAIRAAMRELRESGYVEVHREQGEKGRWQTRIEVFDTRPAERVQAASGATCENSASPQVAPNAGIPAAGGAARKKKYKTSSRARAARGEEAKTSPAAAHCPGCHRAPATGHVPGCPRDFGMYTAAGEQAMSEAMQPVLAAAPSMTPAEARNAIAAAQHAVEAAGHGEANDSEVRWGLLRMVAAVAPFLNYERLRAEWFKDETP